MPPDRKCYKCGKNIPLDSKICPYCGLKFSEETIALEKKKVEEYYKNIKKKHKRKVIGGLALFIIILFILCCLIYVYLPGLSPIPCECPTFTKDSDNKSIFVNRGSRDDQFVWENVRIINGSLELPSGEIELGQRINNCSGRITLEWIPCNKIFFDEEFE